MITIRLDYYNVGGNHISATEISELCIEFYVEMLEGGFNLDLRD